MEPSSQGLGLGDHYHRVGRLGWSSGSSGLLDVLLCTAKAKARRMGVFPKKIRILYLGLAFGVVIGALLSQVGVLPAAICPFSRYLFVSCPMCGTSRAWLLLLHGDPLAAFKSNPLFLLWGLWCLVAFADLLHKSFASRAPTIGDFCIRAVSRNKPLVIAHAVCCVSMFFYLNAVGPTARFRVFQCIHNGLPR